MAISEREKLLIVLDHFGVDLRGVTRGESDATPGELARAIRKSIIAVVIRGEGRGIDLST